MPKNQVVVEAVGLKKVYKDFWGRVKAIGVDSIDFSVQQGEVFGLLGPNGSGKTTTIKLILGLLRPIAGVIKVFNGHPEAINVKRRIGYLPEDTHLYQYLTAEEILDFFGSLFKLPTLERRKRTKELLEMVGLAHAAKRRLGEFSKGMARRIGLAQSLINDPDLLILDEPTTGLDPIGRREVKNLIRHLSKRNKTVVVSSHLLADLEDVCDTVLIIYGGKIQAQGPLKELLTMEDKVQITVPASDQRVINEITTLCRKSSIAGNIAINHPTIRLEELFNRVIKNARRTDEETSGVNSAGPVAECLADNNDNNRSSEQILQEWNSENSALKEKQSGHPPTKVSSDSSPDEEFLKSLTIEDTKKIED